MMHAYVRPFIYSAGLIDWEVPGEPGCHRLLGMSDSVVTGF